MLPLSFDLIENRLWLFRHILLILRTRSCWSVFSKYSDDWGTPGMDIAGRDRLSGERGPFEESSREVELGPKAQQESVDTWATVKFGLVADRDEVSPRFGAERGGR